MVRLVPAFTYPASAWSAKVSLILETAGVDRTKAEDIKQYAPQIIAAMPTDLTAVLPKVSTIDSLLEFLEEYDGPATNMRGIMDEMADMERPSLKYAQTVKQMRKTLPNGTTDVVVNQVAWSLLSPSLPRFMAALLIMLDIKEYPAKEQLDKLDKAFVQGKSKSGSVSAVTAPKEQALINDKIQYTAAAPSTLISKFYTCGQPGHYARDCNLKQQREVTGTVTCQKCGQRGHRAIGCENMERQRTGPVDRRRIWSSSESLCWYHFNYGEKANKCLHPCNWTKETSKGQWAPSLQKTAPGNDS